MRNTIIAVAVALAVGIGIGHFVLQGGGAPSDGAPGTAAKESGEREVLYWVAPMDATYRRDKPGKSPMGMDLVPVYADEAGGGDAVSIAPEIVNNLGVKTAPAVRSDLNRLIDTVGYVAVDETRTAHVHVRASGWVEKLSVKALGETVEEGELLFELYAPDLVSAQAEYLQARKIGNDTLTTAAEDRLVALGMTRAQVAELVRTGKAADRIAVRAPQRGVIMQLNIGEGMYVTPGKTIFALADLSHVWVMVEIFEAQAAWVEKGQAATMTLPFIPGERWQGTVDHVYPTVNEKSRTVRVRLEFDNADGRLKPNMYGNIGVAAAAQTDTLSVPVNALIRSGERDRVILSLGDGRFRPAEVRAGIESGGRVEIVAGLSEGEAVVTSGQFLIDSEASLDASLLRMLPDGDDAADDMDSGMDSASMGMGEMDMTVDYAGDTQGMDMPQEEARHPVVGTLNSFNDDGTVNLTHGPIKTLGMMGMTMNFRVRESARLDRFSEGTRLRFEMVQAPDGWLEVVSAEPVGDEE